MSMSKRICRHLPQSRINTLVDTVMKWKLHDSRRQFNAARYANTKTWRDIRPILQDEGIVREYEELWAGVKERCHQEERRRTNKKVEFLRTKYHAETIVPDRIYGIVVTDREIPAEFQSSPRI